jgi:hypothetical protein
MSEVAIQYVRLDSDGRLRLRPSGPSTYPYIYRDASSVRWDERNRELYVLEVPGFDVPAEFKQIIAAVAREYGDRLVLSPLTEYVGLPDKLIAAFGKAAGEPTVAVDGPASRP